jgi:Fic family protein
MTDAADAASARLERTERLRLHREAEMVSLRSDSTARRLTGLAFGFPVLTVGAAQEMLDVSFQTANAAVATLVRLGILAPHSNIRRNRVFIFGEMLSMLTGAEGAPAG